MWPRILRLFSTGVRAYSNPMQFLLSLAMLIIAPYLIYLFWGSLIFFVLLILGGWLLYRFYKKRTRKV